MVRIAQMWPLFSLHVPPVLPEPRVLRILVLAFYLAAGTLVISLCGSCLKSRLAEGVQYPARESIHLDVRADREILIRPGWVHFTALLRGDITRPEGWRCLTPHWSFGDVFDGARPSTDEEGAEYCTEGVLPRRQWVAAHAYLIPGRFDVHLRLRNRARQALADGSTSVEVK